MGTSSSIRHRFDVEIPHGKFVGITSILKDESTWKLWHRFDVEISTLIPLSNSTKYRWVLHVDFYMSFRYRIDVISVLAVSIVSFPNRLKGCHTWRARPFFFRINKRWTTKLSLCNGYWLGLKKMWNKTESRIYLFVSFISFKWMVMGYLFKKMWGNTGIYILFIF